jgi:hypothetical protein
MADIPSDVALSVSAPFLPHLALRKDVYQYPIIGRADMILLATEDVNYPMSKEDLRMSLDSLLRSPYWDLHAACDGALLFQRKQ